jgi:hypothetical protein
VHGALLDGERRQMPRVEVLAVKLDQWAHSREPR